MYTDGASQGMISDARDVGPNVWDVKIRLEELVLRVQSSGSLKYPKGAVIQRSARNPDKKQSSKNPLIQNPKR